MSAEFGRVGQFFLFAGLIMLILFFFSDQGETPMVGLFFAALACTILGALFIRKDWKAPGPSKRFLSFRKFTQGKPKEKGKGEGEKGS